MFSVKTGGLQQIFGITRTPLSQSQLMKQQQLASTPLLPAGREPDASFHIFPPDPMEFINTKWEENIIWDHEVVF